MKILHYSLGFPPYRSGGLTKYSYDLMVEQSKQGNDVSLLWPGRMLLMSNKIKIKEGEGKCGVKSYELINPLPVSLDEGIKNIPEYMKKGETEIFISFLKKFKPDVIHIHTLMGLYKEFIEAANILNIRVVYTAHDKFGICPKVTFFRNGDICKDYKMCEGCSDCNNTALSLNKIRVMQSVCYRKYKNHKIVKYIRKKHRSQFFKVKNCEIEKKNTISKNKNSSKYIELRKYYISMLEKCDIIHFNSSITRDIFLEFCTPKAYRVINISHSDITDNKKIKKFNNELKLTFLSQANDGKGFSVLKEALDRLEQTERKFVLNVYDKVISKSSYMNVKENYEYSELEKIFDETDILIAPSVWQETFGFTVIEALSYGVPVLISDRVGAKDIVKDEYGWIVKGNSQQAIYDVISKVTVKQLKEKNSNIVNKYIIKSFEEYVVDNYKLYR